MITADAIATQQKWEYCLLTRKTEGYILNEFNALGQEGWELVEVLYYKDMKGIMSGPGSSSVPAAARRRSRPGTKPPRHWSSPEVGGPVARRESR